MNQDTFNEGLRAYEAGNYRSALKDFLASIEHESGSNGRACYMAANCMIRLRRYPDAVTLYRRALLDDTYDNQGPVYTNLGTALVAVGEYDEAIQSFGKAIEIDYPGAYKAYSGMGTALLKCERPEEAGMAFRKAALYDGNPDPGKSLVNLGICFMALDRPNDAAEAYKAALGFENYKARGKALANLGQAYVRAGRMIEAHSAFEKATEAYGQILSPQAELDFKEASESVERRHTGAIPVSEIVHSISQQEASGAVAPQVSGAPEPVLADEEELAQEQREIEEDPEKGKVHPSETGVVPLADSSDVDKFFETSEEDIRKEARQQQKKIRREKKVWLRVLVTIIIIVILLAGAGTAAYFLGFGYPSQNTTITDMMDSYAKGEDVSQYWVATPDIDITREMLPIPASDKVKIDSVDSSANTSTAIITMTLESGSTLDYEVDLEREGLGWKVSGIAPYFASNE